MAIFFKAIFWRGNPKAGAFFGALIVAAMLLALAALAPEMFYVREMYGSGGSSRFVECLAYWNRFFPACILWFCAAALAYAALLHAMYSVALCRFSFNASKMKSTVCGVLFSAAMLPVCALKQRDWPACALLAASAAAATAMALIVRMEALVPTSTQELLALAAMATALAAMRRVKCGKDASRLLAFSPLLLAVVSLLALHACILRRNHRIEAETAELFKAAGIEVTFDDIFAASTNGVPMANEHDELLSSLPRAVYAPSRRDDAVPPWTISDEARAEFDAACATNAAAIALLDALALQREAHPVSASTNPCAILFPQNVATWNGFFSKRIAHAQGSDAAARIIEDARRIDNISHWTASPPIPMRTLLATGMRNGRASRLGAALPKLPDDFLLELRAELRSNRAAPEADCVAMLVHATVYDNWELSGHIAQARGVPAAHSHGLFFNNSPLSRFNVAWFQREQLAILLYAQELVSLLNAPPPDAVTRFSRIMKPSAEEAFPLEISFASGAKSTKEIARAGIFSLVEYQRILDAAIAVELHRRKHGALPATLDALVPEFLDAAPISIFDAAPFTYEHGAIALRQSRLKSGQARDDACIFNGFQICGSQYATYTDGKKRNQCLISVPLEAQ